MRLAEMIYTEEEMQELREENKKLKEIRDNREEKIADLEIEICKLKEERDNFMLKYSKALEEKIVETNNLCTERNKLGEENRKLKLHIEAKDKAYTALLKDYEELKEENKKLKANNEYRNKIVNIIPQDEKSVAEETIQDLQERIRFLEQCLDNKEKVNKSLREENKRLSDFLECEA